MSALFIQIKFLMVILVIVLISIQLSPFGLNNYSDFKVIITITMGILTLLSYKSFLPLFNKERLFRCGIYLVCIVFPVSFLMYSLGGNIDFSYILDIIMANCMILIGYDIVISKKKFTILLNITILSILFTGLSCIFTYSSGFVIQEQYMPVPKNQIAPILSLGCLLSLYLVYHSTNKLYILFLFVLSFLCILVFRARANIVAVAIMFAIYLFYYYKRKTVLFIVFIVLGLALFITPLGTMLYNSFFLNYDVSDINSISAGRSDIYKLSVSYFTNNLFFGRVFGSNPLYDGFVHNYVLFTLENLGLVLSIPLLLYYSYFINKVVKNYSKPSVAIENVGCFIILVPFIISLFEYSYPYSPGSAVFVAYFCFGYSLKYPAEIGVKV